MKLEEAITITITIAIAKAITIAIAIAQRGSKRIEEDCLSERAQRGSKRKLEEARGNLSSASNLKLET